MALRVPFGWRRQPAAGMAPDATRSGSLCVVAILRDESSFVDEWLAYHRLLGVDHFILYDDDPALPLRQRVQPHGECVTVVDWFGASDKLPGRNRQTKAYTDSLARMGGRFRWVAFIDGDEFLVLRRHAGIQDFLGEFDRFDAVSLNWHVFGHNGLFHDPVGLVTSALTRRMLEPGPQIKTINKVAAIERVESAHLCLLRPGCSRVDANQREFSTDLYHGKTDVAHVNHYMCRSFVRWMARARRGDVIDDGRIPREIRWKTSEASCLQHFVTAVAKDKNEFVDDYMLRFAAPIKAYLKRCGIRSRAGERSRVMEQ